MLKLKKGTPQNHPKTVRSGCNFCYSEVLSQLLWAASWWISCNSTLPVPKVQHGWKMSFPFISGVLQLWEGTYFSDLKNPVIEDCQSMAAQSLGTGLQLVIAQGHTIECTQARSCLAAMYRHCNLLCTCFGWCLTLLSVLWGWICIYKSKDWYIDAISTPQEKRTVLACEFVEETTRQSPKKKHINIKINSSSLANSQPSVTHYHQRGWLILHLVQQSYAIQSSNKKYNIQRVTSTRLNHLD